MATFVVDSPSDTVDANPGDGVAIDSFGQTTLRAAIMEANALAGDDTIIVPATTIRLTIPGVGEDAAATGDLDITDHLTIEAYVEDRTIIDGNGLDRVFQISAGVNVSITGLTITGGLVAGDGGGIHNRGSLSLGKTTVSHNVAGGGSNRLGGGIYHSPLATGSLTLNLVTVADNMATQEGGGIYSGGNLSIERSLIARNTAGIKGGGLALNRFSQAMTTVINSTVSGNQATTPTSRGGGILAEDAALTIRSSTISENTSATGGGVYAGGLLRKTTLKNTIVAGNSAVKSGPDVAGRAYLSQGHNLIGDVGQVREFISSDLVGGGGKPVLEAGLLPLTSFSGTPATHALFQSIAVNAGDNADAPETDQRGVLRVIDGTIDIGAYEEISPKAMKLTFPVADTVVTSTTEPTFRWASIPAAASYELWVNDLTTGESGILRVTEISGSSYTPTTPLPDGHEFVWTVRAVHSSGAKGVFATHQEFSLHVHAPQLSQPQLIAPLGTTTASVSPTFVWSEISGADRYEIIVNDLTAGKSSIIQDKYVVGTEFTAPLPLIDGHEYLWTVRGVTSEGRVGKFAAAAKFSLNVAQPRLAAPELLGPSRLVALNTTPTFEWSAIAGADHYDLWVNDRTTGEIGVIRNKNVGGRSFTSPVELTLAHEYQWTVRAVTASGVVGEWAPHVDFQIIDPVPPGIPLVAGTLVASSDRPRFAWGTVDGVAEYDLWVNDLSTGQSQVIRQHVVQRTFYDPDFDLERGHSYAWTVRAISPSGIAGDWAPVGQVDILLSAPSLTAPQYGSRTTSIVPTFSWQPVTGAERYDLWVNDLTTGHSEVIREKSLQETMFAPNAPLILGHSYAWTVRAISEFDVEGAWAQTSYVDVVPSSPTLTGPPYGPTLETRPEFRWEPVVGADHYELWIVYRDSQETVLREPNIPTTSYIPPTPLPVSDNYIWTVRAIDMGGTPGEWAPHEYFAVVLPIVPAIPRLIDPTGIISNLAPTLVWEVTNNATTYDPRLVDQGSGNSVELSYTYVAGASDRYIATPKTNLKLGHTYQWTVRGISTVGLVGEFAVPLEFTIGIQAPQDLQPGRELLNRTPTLSWSPVASADHYDLWVNNLTTGEFAIIREQNLTATSYTPTVPLRDDSDYTFTVRAVTVDGLLGEWAQQQVFTVALNRFLTQQPTLYGPFGEVTTTSVTLSWYRFVAAGTYQIVIDNVTTGEDGFVDAITGPIVVGAIPGRAYQPVGDEALTFGHEYHWRIRAIGPDGQLSPWSDESVLRVVPPPPIELEVIAAGMPAGFVRPVFQWQQPVPGADHFEILVHDLTTGSSAVIHRDDIPAGEDFVADTDLTLGHDYEWTVRAIAVSGTPGPWSAAARFTAPALDPPTIISPFDITVTTSRPVFEWTSVVGADHYDLWVILIGSGETVVREKTLTTNTFTPTIDLMGYEFNWTVRAFDAQGRSSGFAPNVVFSLRVAALSNSKSAVHRKPVTAGSSMQGHFATPEDFEDIDDSDDILSADLAGADNLPPANDGVLIDSDRMVENDTDASDEAWSAGAPWLWEPTSRQRS